MRLLSIALENLPSPARSAKRLASRSVGEGGASLVEATEGGNDRPPSTIASYFNGSLDAEHTQARFQSAVMPARARSRGGVCEIVDFAHADMAENSGGEFRQRLDAFIRRMYPNFLGKFPATALTNQGGGAVI